MDAGGGTPYYGGPRRAISTADSRHYYSGINNTAGVVDRRGTGDWYELQRTGFGDGGGGMGQQEPPSSSARASRKDLRSNRASKAKSYWQQFKEGFKALIAFVFSNVGICVLVIGYLLAGAVCFQAIEGPSEVGVRFHVTEYRNKTVQTLWKITEQYNTIHKENWTLATQKVISEFQAHILEQKSNGYGGADIPGPTWTFSGALLYSITVITTIGK